MTRTQHLGALAMIAATLATSLLALAALSKPAEAAFPGKNGRVVFASSRTGNNEIYAKSGKFGTFEYVAVQLTNDPDNDSDPAVSPDGNKIAFVSDRDGNDEVYVMNSDGTGQTRLTFNVDAFDIGPTFSPDGTKISFQSWQDGEGDIYVMDATDGSDQTNLTDNPANDYQPAFSPDGTKIAFTSNRDGNGEIYTMNALDGSNLKNLTDNPAEDNSPDYAPNGKKIVFDSTRDALPGQSNLEIYAMKSNGTDEKRLTYNAQPGLLAIDYEPAFSPDGKHVVFTSYRNGNYEVYRMNDKGGDQTNFTKHPAGDVQSDWGPNPG